MIASKLQKENSERILINIDLHIVDMEDLTLYVKGMAPTELEDVWDDTALINAYDNALKLAKEEVAKRIAMETNTAGKSKSGKGQEKAKKDATPSKPIVWKEGMPCRAIYEEDGLEYEAFLMNFVDDDDCVVKFLGYENFETVPISSLKPTQGNEARLRQLDEAAGSRDDDGFESQPHSESQDLYSEEPSSPEPVHIPVRSSKKKTNKRSQGPASHYGDLPSIHMPNMSMIRNLGGAVTPLPPPPPLLAACGDEAEQQAISDMLLSWYMTGYHTGLYQGMKRAQQMQSKQSRRY